MNIKNARKKSNDNNNIEDEMLVYINDHPRCEITNKSIHPSYHPHRIKSAGAGGKYTHDNMIRLCPELHAEIHGVGIKHFCIKYAVEKLRKILISRGSWSESDQDRFLHNQKIFVRTEIVE